MKRVINLFALITLGLILVACAKTTYTVTFESNGGTEITEVKVEKDKLLNKPDDPTRPGFVFGGWYKDSDLTDRFIFETDKITENTTLYAMWAVSDIALVNQVYDWLSLGDLTGLTNQSPRIIFPATRDSVSITWAIDKTDYIKANGLINQPEHEVGDQVVTLTATLTKNDASRTKTFTATVLALPSLSETTPLISEDFKGYTDGNIIGQSGLWAPVSAKSGNSQFTVVSTQSLEIPKGSKALKIEAFSELQIEAPITHSYDLVVFEVDLMQSSSSNASAINIQSSSSSPVVAFGLDGANLFYRTDNGTLMKTEIEVNKWYTLRVEVDLVNKTIEAFYYEDGQLVSLSMGKVTYTGSTPLQSLFIRSGSSNTEFLRQPAYISNLVANRIEALPRPVEVKKLGHVTDLRETVSIEEGSTFSLDTPKIHNYYGMRDLLVLDTDYTLTVTNPVDTAVAGDYDVVYTFTNKHNALDVKSVTQTVTVYSKAQPNVINSVVSSEANYLVQESDITITLVQPLGKLYYLLSNSETADALQIKAGESVDVITQTVTLTDLSVEGFEYIHVIVELNGDSNIINHQILKEAVIEINTAEAFASVFSVTATEIKENYALTADIDLTGITWADGNTSLKGKFYGNGHKISNLTMTKTGDKYGGLFARINGGMVRDLVLDNIHVTSNDRGGILVGRVENTSSVIENIVITNSSITAANSNGVGGVIGLVSKETRLSNVSIMDSIVTASGVKNVGAVVGRVDGGELIATDIFVLGVTVKSTVLDALDIAAGGLVGYVRDSNASIVTANRIVIVDTTIEAQIGGALIGYIKSTDTLKPTVTVTNAYLDVSFNHETKVSTGLIGRVNNETDKISTTSIFGVIENQVTHAQTQAFTNTTTPTNLEWWTTNLSEFTSSNLWTIDQNFVFVLNNYLENSLPLIDVTVIYNIEEPNEVVSIRQGKPFDFVAPSIGGYVFKGFFLDENLTVALPLDYVVEAADTIYAKYETAPASVVSFITNIPEVLVDNQAVNYGGLATKPVVANQMIGEFLMEAQSWTLDGEPFDFSTPILENVELVAVWTKVKYTVKFTGGEDVVVEYGDKVDRPLEDPTHYFAEVLFAEWRKDGVAYDFESAVTSNITLVPHFSAPTGDIKISTPEMFHHMATVESTYSYVLENNLDFTGFEWTYVNTSFKGSLDGKGYEISNLTLIGTTYSAVFPRANGAVISNLVLDNVSVTGTGRAGILVGRIENNETTIQNIVIKNSSVTGNESNGVGGLVGQISKSSSLFNIVISETNIHNALNNVGGLVGRLDSGAVVIADDIFISGVSVKSDGTGTSDVGASALVGYVANAADTVFSGVRVVVVDTVVDGNVTAAFVGYNRYPGTADLMDAYFEVTFVNNERSGLIGYNRDQTVVLDQSSIFGSFTNNTHHSNALALTNEAVPTDATWWETNLNNIFTSDLYIISSNGEITRDVLVDNLVY